MTKILFITRKKIKSSSCGAISVILFLVITWRHLRHVGWHLKQKNYNPLLLFVICIQHGRYAFVSRLVHKSRCESRARKAKNCLRRKDFLQPRRTLRKSTLSVETVRIYCKKDLKFKNNREMASSIFSSKIRHQGPGCSSYVVCFPVQHSCLTDDILKELRHGLRMLKSLAYIFQVHRL